MNNMFGTNLPNQFRLVTNGKAISHRIRATDIVELNGLKKRTGPNRMRLERRSSNNNVRPDQF
jgi:hypothetical protein